MESSESISPVHEREIVPFSPCFCLPPATGASMEALMHVFFPDSLLDRMVPCTNAYSAQRVEPRKRRTIGNADLLRFFATLYYMGVVRISAKTDYFDDSSTILQHHPGIRMEKAMFLYLWRNFHMHMVAGSAEGADEKPPDEEEENGDDDENDGPEVSTAAAAAASAANGSDSDSNEDKPHASLQVLGSTIYQRRTRRRMKRRTNQGFIPPSEKVANRF
jgi:Transposase IS4